jgi:hypothetical protein
MFNVNIISTHAGFVLAWTVNEGKWQTTKLEFIHSGVKYHRRWDRVFGKKTITRLAREFMEDVTGSNGGG